METEFDPQLQWSKLLEGGDVAALLAVFRETVDAAGTPNQRDLRYSLLTFLESNLFTAALDVDLPALCSTSSAEYVDAILQETCIRSLDPREVLSELLSIVRLGSGQIITVYFRLLRAALRQILLDALRRRKDNCTVEEQLLKTQTTMRAWYVSVGARISDIICTLAQRDALPQTVRSVHKIQGCDSSSDDNDVEANDISFAVPSIYSDTLEALFNLLLDLFTMSRETKKTIHLLLMVKALTVSTQPYHKDDDEDNDQIPPNILVFLSQWSRYFYCGNHYKSKRSISGSIPEDLSSVVPQNDFIKIGVSVTEALLRILPMGEILPALLDSLENAFCAETMDSITYDDNERGKDASRTKALTSLHDLKGEKEIIKVLSDNELSCEHDDIHPDSLSLRRIGAMMTLLDVMMRENCSSYSGFSNSPTTLFFVSGPLFLESLKSSSLCGVIPGLVFLFVLLSHIDVYSISADGEVNWESSKIYDFVEKSTTWPSFSFRTRRFELIFELVKVLITIATTCPSKEHRLISREIFTILLQRCAADLRMLLYSSFLVVTPFASICSLMLHSLRSEWSSCQSLCNPSEYILLRQMLPRCLIQAQEHWVKKLRFGEKSFVDPLIQSINFVRFIIAEDCRRDVGDALFQFDSTRSRVCIRETSDEGSRSGNCWDEYLRQLLDVVVAPLRRALACAADGDGVSITTLPMAELSPLDEFALNMALDGLEKQLTCTA